MALEHQEVNPGVLWEVGPHGVRASSVESHDLHVGPPLQMVNDYYD